MNYVDTASALEPVLKSVAKSPWVSVDTEADSLHHYTEKFCLMQLTTPDGNFVIDPLSGIDLLPLLKLLEEKELLLHGADFDIRLMNRLAAFKPRVIFDTVIAAQLLGYDKQSLADIVHRHCNVTLSKASQTTDWSVRPLDEKHIVYAANDTHYLKTVADLMRAELEANHRLAWHHEACEKLLKSILEPRQDDDEERPEWLVKGANKLDGRGLTIVKALWYWRETEAKRLDRPRFKVLTTDTVLDIAEWAAKSHGTDVAEFPGCPRHLKGLYRTPVNEALKKAYAEPETRLESKRHHHRPGKQPPGDYKDILGKLKAVREETAKVLGINPSLLGTNAAMDVIIVQNPTSVEKLIATGALMKWQAEILGEAIVKVLRRIGPLC